MAENEFREHLEWHFEATQESLALAIEARQWGKSLEYLVLLQQAGDALILLERGNLEGAETLMEAQ